MAKRHARVKLSRAQKLENERNRWMAKKDAAIEMLVKSIGKLKELDRSVARMERTAQLPKKPAKAQIAAVVEAANEALAEPVGWVFPEAKPKDDGLDIPTSLKREAPRQVMVSGDKELEDVVDAARNGDDKAKIALRIRKLKVGQERKQAELTGKRRKMPLTGKDALAAIKDEAPEPGQAQAAAREARMKSLGFRKIKK